MGDSIRQMADVYKLTADKAKFTMITLLLERELCVCDITGQTGMPRPNASQHFRKLKASALLNKQTKGQWVHDSLNASAPVYDPCMYEHLPAMITKPGRLQPNRFRAQEEL